MGTIYQITCALCIIFLRFPLYYLAPVGNILNTDVLSNDTSLCDSPIKQLFSKSEYTKQCATLSYPPNIDKLNLTYSTMETFLCLGMHDAVYKVCQYAANKKWNNTFSKNEDLDFSIQNITGFKSDGAATSKNLMVYEKNFCQRLTGYTPVYEKLKPALLKLANSLKDPDTCNKICIDIDHKLNPLCAVLGWINQIDQAVKNSTITTTNPELGKAHNNKDNIPQAVQHQEKSAVANTDHNIPPSSYASAGEKIERHNIPPSGKVNLKFEEKKKKEDMKIIEDTKSEDDNSQLPIDPPSTTQKDAMKEASFLVEKAHKKNVGSAQSPSINSNMTLQMNVSQPVKALDPSHVEQHGNMQKLDSAITNAHTLPKTVESEKDIVKSNKNSNVDKSVNNKAIISSTEEIKSTTLSENTQDNIVEDNALNNPNPDDFSRVDDVQLPDNSIDSLSQPVEIDNRNENVPDTSGQREMENFHVTKNDEESHFFTYFAITSLGFIGGYIAYHNKQKILAIVLEGRRSKNNRGRRRPSTANYRKLDCTLEEAVTSQCNANVTHVIY